MGQNDLGTHASPLGVGVHGLETPGPGRGPDMRNHCPRH
ncbi:hypothetical protein SLI_0219 [Streptomyces lividans 1326]|uniref:Uncharacterized protein n=1 Tax=Streptomyces lividans 1326 TaxID=1200984 RepID=A0A7U9H828_STRLI|nr:hypothetical protein SLI_0219 [Streptomyces lividans 1326]